MAKKQKRARLIYNPTSGQEIIEEKRGRSARCFRRFWL